MRWRFSSSLGLAALLLAGCNDLVPLGHGRGGTSGTDNGESGAPVSAGSDHGGPAGGTSASAGGAPGSAGESSSSGGEDSPLEGYRFDLIRPLEGPDTPQAEPGEERLTGTTADLVSKDGSLLFGAAEYEFAQPGSSPQRSESLPFYWTRQTGPRRFEEFAGVECLAPDGSAAFGSLLDSAREATGAFRWTLAAGIEALPAESGKIPKLHSCAPDGTAATGWFTGTTEGMIGAARWQQGENGNAVVQMPLPGQPESNESDAWISADGSAAIIEQGWPLPVSTYRWTPASGATAIGAPPNSEEFCALAHKDYAPNVGVDFLRINRRMMSADASVLVALCGESEFFRWTLASGSWTPLPSLVTPPSWMSEDGLSFIGLNVNGQPAVWSEGGAAEVIASPGPNGVGTVLATSEDGNVAYASFGFGVAGTGTTNALVRWRRGQGTTLLSLPPGDTGATVTACSTDGSVAVGYSWNAEQEVRGLLWDEQETRDITAELVAAGVDLEDVTDLMPKQVWSGPPIVVRGTGKPSYFAEIVWFAELPAPH